MASTNEIDAGFFNRAYKLFTYVATKEGVRAQFGGNMGFYIVTAALGLTFSEFRRICRLNSCLQPYMYWKALLSTASIQRRSLAHYPDRGHEFYLILLKARSHGERI
jgi:hypothetical protein